MKIILELTPEFTTLHLQQVIAILDAYTEDRTTPAFKAHFDTTGPMAIGVNLYSGQVCLTNPENQEAIVRDRYLDFLSNPCTY